MLNLKKTLLGVLLAVAIIAIPLAHSINKPKNYTKEEPTYTAFAEKVGG
jgi:hypothetical protein